MAFQNKKIAFVCIMMVLTTACTHTARRYNPSAANVEEIRLLTKNIKGKVADGNFTATEQKTSIICRAAGPVTAPDGKTFNQYIKDAIFEEFKFAGIYEKNSSKALSAKLDFIDFSSGISESDWTMRMTFSGNSGKPFTVESKYTFGGAFVANQACQLVADELPNATQKLILALVKHPEFKKLLTQ